MAKQRGHRANKPNDSFGVTNNDQLYRGKYRDEVYKDDDEELEASSEDTQESDPAPQEAATQDSDSFVPQRKQKKRNTITKNVMMT